MMCPQEGCSLLSQPLEAQKDILGYTLKERVGSGGFGEVWSAVRPADC